MGFLSTHPRVKNIPQKILKISLKKIDFAVLRHFYAGRLHGMIIYIRVSTSLNF